MWGSVRNGYGRVVVCLSTVQIDNPDHSLKWEHRREGRDRGEEHIVLILFLNITFVQYLFCICGDRQHARLRAC